MYVQGKSALTIMNFTHNKINRAMPVVTYPDTPMWIRSLNGFNDSPQTRNNKLELTNLTSKDEREFMARFAIDQNTVRQVHSAV